MKTTDEVRDIAIIVFLALVGMAAYGVFYG